VIDLYGDNMNLKIVGNEILFRLKHPFAIIVDIILLIEIGRMMREAYLEDTALERMIYSKK